MMSKIIRVNQANVSPFVLVSTLLSVCFALLAFISLGKIPALICITLISISNLIWFVKFDSDNEITRTNELVFLPQLISAFLVGI